MPGLPGVGADSNPNLLATPNVTQKKFSQFVFDLLQTGNIWFAIGTHAAFDWGETFVYSVPDSGLPAQGHLFNSSFHGPFWLTGGSVGPEGSAFAILVLLIGALAIHFLFPVRHLQL